MTARPGDTAALPLKGWNSSQRIYCNTTASGAQVYGTVIGFPALVRLTHDNFDFSRARGDGADVRFTRSDNKPMAHEIERWDSAGGAAEIWVRVDTVYGNDSAHYFIMYWGASANAAQTSASNGPAVFDTAAGFIGVWHLNRTCDDATANRHNGTNSGAADSTGMIGSAKGFNGNEGIKIAGLLGQPRSVTLSAWARLDTLQRWGSEVISLGNAVLLRMDHTQAPGGGVMGSYHVSSDTLWYNVVSDMYLQKTGWHYLSFAMDGVNHTQTLSIDGMVYSYRSNQAPIYYSGIGTDTWIGRHGNKETNWFFNGIIDEVRVSRTVHSNDWTKLCYMNQKAKDALLVFR